MNCNVEIANAIVGVPGLPGDTQNIIAAVDIGADRAITATGGYCDPNDINSLNAYVGISVKAGSKGDSIQIINSGQHIIYGATFEPNKPLFIGANGVLTHTMPSGSFRRIGWTITPEILNFDTLQTIEREKNGR